MWYCVIECYLAFISRRARSTTLTPYRALTRSHARRRQRLYTLRVHVAHARRDLTKFSRVRQHPCQDDDHKCTLDNARDILTHSLTASVLAPSWCRAGTPRAPTPRYR